MSRPKIAPRLTKWVRVPFREDPRTLYELNQAAAELRALLAVSKKARGEHQFCPTFETCPTCRFLARLDRVSSGTGQRKGRGSRSPEGTEDGR